MAVQFFYICLIAGLFLFGAEIFVPGGLLGAIGAALLLAAIILGFFAYDKYGTYIAVLILALTVGAVIAWMKIFPKTPYGKHMTVSNDLSDSVATEAGLDELIGKHGESASPLRPAGFALIDDRRIDVVTQGEMIDRGEPIRVVSVEGNRVIVEKHSGATGTT
jgi:membrane-bound serine protease (ClpP class)